MKKRLLPSLLALALILPLFPTARAAVVTVEEKAQVLAALEIMVGNENGDLMLDRPVTRAQFTKLTLAATPNHGNVGASTPISPYPDVPYTHWAAPWVEAAVQAGYVKGFLDGTFHPDEGITLVQGVTMAVRLLGYQDADFSTGVWGAGQMALYHDLGLDKDISIGRDDPMTRLDAMNLFYNLLTAKTRTGQTYLLTLGHTLTLSGEIDRVALVNSTMKGPMVAAGAWTDELGFPPEAATVYRDGKPASSDAIQTNDILYWSGSLRTVWAYCDQVTGEYQAAAPNPSSPSAVTVAGRTYSIETADAAYALSSLEGFQVGDNVTLLLGRDGAVAAVVPPDGEAGTLCCVVTAVTESALSGEGEARRVERSLSLTATDGSVRSYSVPSDDEWEVGDLAQVTFTQRDTQITKLSPVSAAGWIGPEAAALGDTPFADDVQIMEVAEDGQCLTHLPRRLAGARLSKTDVLYCRTNAAGEIDRLILNDFTGDLLSYGVLTDVREQEIPSSVPGRLSTLLGTYTYDVGGRSYTSTTQGKLYRLGKGPVQVSGPLFSPTGFKALTASSLASVSEQTAITQAGSTLRVWDKVTVYELIDQVYYLSDLDQVLSGYTLTGYHDKPAAQGGCIRVIVAQPDQ